jgi:hypothetical protein
MMSLSENVRRPYTVSGRFSRRFARPFENDQRDSFPSFFYTVFIPSIKNNDVVSLFKSPIFQIANLLHHGRSSAAHLLIGELGAPLSEKAPPSLQKSPFPHIKKKFFFRLSLSAPPAIPERPSKKQTIAFFYI